MCVVSVCGVFMRGVCVRRARCVCCVSTVCVCVCVWRLRAVSVCGECI